MSLLLDALKRAEQEKLAKQGEGAPGDGGAAPSRRDMPAANSAPALELHPIATPPAGQPKPAAADAAPAKTGAATAQAVFQAKAAPRKEGTSRNLLLWIGAGVIVLIALAIGAYVLYSLNSLQPRITTLRSRPAPAPQGGATQAAATPRFDAPVPPAAPTPAPAGPAKLETIAPAPAVATAPPARLALGAITPEAAAQLVKDAPATAPSMRLTPTPKPRVPMEVAAGYDALRSGDLPAARRSYAAALAADGANVDAHLGLATVEARLGNVAAAVSHYRRSLDLDPRNATALAGLASLADGSRQPEMLEGQLRADLARYPQSAALHFALGNLYASRRRWDDAQAEFFEAHRLEPAGADILFNLAVSMDHMGQARLAADYYRRALDAARSQAAQFDPAPVARRLEELRP